ncbi:MAG TPA: hypothetical protein PLU52_08140 [Opitutaceae bacterium]|nr:hypothetical protein [Opitutaceae bacterium]HND62697.1 hypothetical protein [Opitutaceae bacterium]
MRTNCRPLPLRPLIRRLAALAAALILGVTAPAMVFRPAQGSMWDPTILWHDGLYYAFMMYDTEGDDAYCLLATSPDGVHWTEQGKVISEHDRPDGASFFKCFVAKVGDRFVMNHGVGRFEGKHQLPQDTMRFYESKDLRHWTYLATTHPDPRWYLRDRWDHMYMLPKEEGRPEAGLWGYVVSVPKEGVDLPGMMQSSDGRTWEVLPPARTEWGEVKPRNHFEYGGCERIGGKYYLLGGASGYNGHKGYATYTLIGDGPRGPFRPDAAAFRLCGNTGEFLTWLASWVRARDGLLVANYSLLRHGQPGPCLLPLRRPVIDADGHLRLGWWPGNEAIKGRSLPLTAESVALTAAGQADGWAQVLLDVPNDRDRGLVLEGRITACAAATGAAPAAGVMIEEQPGKAMALLMSVGRAETRETWVGQLTTGADGRRNFVSEDVSGKGSATVTGLDPDRAHTFRLLCHWELFELYVDDLLVQTYTREPGSGRVGFAVRGAQIELSGLRAWEMSYSP